MDMSGLWKRPGKAFRPFCVASWGCLLEGPFGQAAGLTQSFVLKSLFAAFVLTIFLTVLAMIFCWFLDRRRKLDKLNATVRDVNLALKKEWVTLIADRERAQFGPGYLSKVRIDERRELLESVQRSLNEARSARSLKAKGGAVETAERTYWQQRVCALSDKADEIDLATQTALAAMDRGEQSFPINSLGKIRVLTASARRELDATKPRPVGFSATFFRVQEAVSIVEPAEKAVRKARGPLADAEAIATEIGLL